MRPVKRETDTMKFTGERYVPEVRGNIELEHLHRYLQACEFAIGKDVLDIASGEGYGSAMLAHRSKTVIGVDISRDAVRHARGRYRLPNLDFKVGSCSEIPLATSCVDVVVSFETIEHHDDHHRMMQEVKRVLRPGGVLIISSPDKYHYSIEPGYSNEYHVRELYEHEFKELLATYFLNRAYFGQRIFYGSGIFPEETPTSFATYLSNQSGIVAVTGMPTPMYWIAVATDGEMPTLVAGVLEQPIEESDPLLAKSRLVADRESEIAYIKGSLVELENQQSILAREIAEIRPELIERERKVLDLEGERERFQKQLSDLRDSLQLLERDNSNLRSAISARDQKLTELQDNAASLQLRIFELESAVSKESERRIEVASEKDVLEKQMFDVKESVKDRNLHIFEIERCLRDTRDQLESVLLEQSKRAAQVASEKNSLNEQIFDLEELLKANNEQIMALGASLRDVKGQLEGTLSSKSWRVTRPLREARRLSKMAGTLLNGQISRATLKSKALYSLLPIDSKTKAVHRRFLSRYIPRALMQGARIPDDGTSLLLGKSRKEDFSLEMGIRYEGPVILRPCVLIVDHSVPQADRDAGSRTMMQIVEVLLAIGSDVAFWPMDQSFNPVYTPRLQALGVQVILGTEYQGRLENWMDKNGPSISCVLLSRPHIAAQLLEAVRRNTKAKIAFYGHDIHYLRFREQMKWCPEAKESLAREALMFEELEHRVWRDVDVIFYPSDAETDLVQDWLATNKLQGKAVTIPVFGFDDFHDEVTQPLESRAGILFVAGFGHQPNVDGARWFMTEILPLVRKANPRASLALVGSNPTDEMRKWAETQVHIAGFVSDSELRRWYQRSRIAVAPLRFGAGMKGKVVEAMANGLPIVTTTTGRQGLGDAKEFLPAFDEPSEFAAEILNLLDNDVLWLERATRARNFAKERFSRKRLRQVLELHLMRVHSDTPSHND